MKVLLNFNDDGTVTCEDWIRAAGMIEDEAFERGHKQGVKEAKREDNKDVGDAYRKGREDGYKQAKCESQAEAWKAGRDKGYEDGFTEGRESMKNEEFQYTLLDLLEKKEEGYKEGLEEGFRKGKEAGKEYASEDIAAEKSKAFEDGYAAGKRDGEKSRFFDIPDEVKKHIDEVLKWMET